MKKLQDTLQVIRETFQKCSILFKVKEGVLHQNFNFGAELTTGIH